VEINKSDIHFIFPHLHILIFMKKILSILLFVPCVINAQDYLKLHRKAIVADSHNDILTASLEKKVSMDNDLRGKTHSDLARFKQGGVDVQLFSVWCDGAKQATLCLGQPGDGYPVCGCRTQPG
jgi:hypothetical protein